MKRGSAKTPGGEARKRLFFALWPPAQVRDVLFAWARACQPQTEGRPVAHANLHVTLAFLGMLERPGCEAAIAIGKALPAAAFELVLDRIGYWRESRIVYAAPSRMPAPLAALAGALSARLAGAGLRTEERPYSAHVTLLRDARRAPSERDRAPLSWNVCEMALMESRHEQGRLVYRPLERWTLSG